MESMTEHVFGKRRKQFLRTPHYYPEGDYLTLYFHEDRCFAKPIDDRLTVFLSMADRKIVGFKIDRVGETLDRAKSFGMDLDMGSFEIKLLFLLGSEKAADKDQKGVYDEVGKMFKQIEAAAMIVPGS